MQWHKHFSRLKLMWSCCTWCLCVSTLLALEWNRPLQLKIKVIRTCRTSSTGNTTLAIASLASRGSCFLSWEIWCWNLLRHCDVMSEGCVGTQRCNSPSNRAINHPNPPAGLENISAKVWENFTATTRQQLSTVFQLNPNNWLAQPSALLFSPPSTYCLCVGTVRKSWRDTVRLPSANSARDIMSLMGVMTFS